MPEFPTPHASSLHRPVTFVGGEIESVGLPLSSLLQASLAFEAAEGSLEFSHHLAALGTLEERAELFAEVLAVLSTKELQAMRATGEGRDALEQIASLQSFAAGSLDQPRKRIEEVCEAGGGKGLFVEEGDALARSLADTLLWEVAPKTSDLVGDLVERLVNYAACDPVVAGAIAGALLGGMRPDLLGEAERDLLAKGILRELVAGTLPRVAETSFGAEALARAFALADGEANRADRDAASQSG